MSNDKSKLTHNINSNLSSISQALPIIAEAIRNDPDQAEKILKLCSENFEKLMKDWDSLKSQS